MSDTKPAFDRLAIAVTRSPILWGGLASVGFYGLVHAGLLQGEIIQLYFTDHPVEYVATVMFFVALAVLILKAFDIATQHQALHESPLGPPQRRGDAVRNASAMLDRLTRLPAARQTDYLVGRLRDTLEYVRRRGSAEGLDEQMQYLADLDAGRLHASYALVRVIIWAIPILGFLGTVIGITMAIANLADGAGLTEGAVENSIPQVVGGLSVAFATTTQALVLSIILMFAQYYVDKQENALLAEVDQQATVQLDGRFEHMPAGPEGQIVAVRRMAEALIDSTEKLVSRQAELWQQSMEAAATRWNHMADSAGKQLQASLGAALRESMQHHAQQLTNSEKTFAQQSHQRWESLQQSQSQNIQAMGSLQTSMARQADMLGRAVEATGSVIKLEEALNRNLASLSGAKNFEQTVMSLAAAIHLLNARLTDSPDGTPPVSLESSQQSPKAA